MANTITGKPRNPLWARNSTDDTEQQINETC